MISFYELSFKIATYWLGTMFFFPMRQWQKADLFCKVMWNLCVQVVSVRQVICIKGVILQSEQLHKSLNLLVL
jgi:hypothetical protein